MYELIVRCVLKNRYINIIDAIREVTSIMQFAMLFRIAINAYLNTFMLEATNIIEYRARYFSHVISVVVKDDISDVIRKPVVLKKRQMLIAFITILLSSSPLDIFFIITSCTRNSVITPIIVAMDIMNDSVPKSSAPRDLALKTFNTNIFPSSIPFDTKEPIWLVIRLPINMAWQAL